MSAMSARSAHTRRRADAGFVLDVRSLGRRAGTMKELQRRVAAPSRIGPDLIAVPEGGEIDLDLRLEAVSEGVLVTGTVRADVVGECARCLESFQDSLELPITELFAYPDSATEQTTEEGEVYRVADEHVDLEPAVVDAVVLGLPLQPLCSEDCPGLCAECGVRLAIAGTEHRHETMDPRWAGLAAKLGEITRNEPDVSEQEK
jgi:uncharacterized protein